jgi:hypothetical protein
MRFFPEKGAFLPFRPLEKRKSPLLRRQQRPECDNHESSRAIDRSA